MNFSHLKITTNFFIRACIIIFLAGCLCPSIDATKYNVFAAINETFVGDRDQILGICNALRDLGHEVNITRISITGSKSKFDASEFCKQLQSSIDIAGSEMDKSRFVILSSGDYGVDLIQYLKKNESELAKMVLTCYTTHQITACNKELIGVADFMAVPAHVVDERFKEENRNSSTVFVYTIGVAHNTTLGMIRSAYKDNEDLRNKITVKPPYLIVVLGGDAPDPYGRMRYYLPEGAEKLADVVAKKGLRLLILNGRRTGQHDPESGLEAETGKHRDGSLDKATKAFVDELKANGLVEGVDFNLFDFQFDDPLYCSPLGRPGIKMVVYGALKECGGEFWVAGESTSMVSEATSLFDSVQVVIVENGAMNENHKKHMQMEYEKGRAGILTADMKLVPHKCEILSDFEQKSAATVIAREIAQMSKIYSP